MDYENLWKTDSGDTQYTKSTENIILLMNAQCNYLSMDTEGKVFAVFGEIKKDGVISAMLQTLAYVTNSVSGVMGNQETIDGLSTEHLIDAKSMYFEKTFGFEICDEKYRYRAFELKMTPVYPVEMRIDEDIYKHIRTEIDDYVSQGDSCSIIVENDENFKQVIKRIFSDQKVRYIISELKSRAEHNKAVEVPRKVIICEGRNDEIIINAVARKLGSDVMIVVADGKTRVPQVFDNVKAKNSELSVLVIVDGDNDYEATKKMVETSIKCTDYKLIIAENTIEDWFINDITKYSKLKLMQQIVAIIEQKDLTEIRKKYKSFDEFIDFLEQK